MNGKQLREMTDRELMDGMDWAVSMARTYDPDSVQYDWTLSSNNYYVYQQELENRRTDHVRKIKSTM